MLNYAFTVDMNPNLQRYHLLTYKGRLSLPGLLLIPWHYAHRNVIRVWLLSCQAITKCTKL